MNYIQVASSMRLTACPIGDDAESLHSEVAIV